ncbi:MAG TPA: phosphatase PAP2 family protein [Mycobacteriales bacterium]
MNTVIVVVAEYLLYVLAAIAFGVWLVQSRRGKVVLGLQAVVALVLVGVGITVAAALHADPRPFVHDPHSHPLFAHAADNGFPSDHSVAAAMVAALVFAYRRALGLIVAAGAVLVAVSRVAAHVHHAQDVVAGLALGALAGYAAVWLVNRTAARVAPAVTA